MIDTEKTLDNFGLHLSCLREKRNLSINQIYEKTGLSKSFISAMEVSDKLPGLETLLILANALKVSVSELVDEVNNKLLKRCECCGCGFEPSYLSSKFCSMDCADKP